MDGDDRTSHRGFDKPDVALPCGGRMPLLGFGTWQLSGSRAQQAVEWALAAGYRHVDTATMYRNESQVGAAIESSGLSRDEVFLTTKLAPDRFGRARQTLEQSLQSLGVDQVDLWLVHWPPRGGSGVEPWPAFVEAREEGLVAAIGVSNYSLRQIDELTNTTGVTPAVNQVEWSPFLHDPAVLQGHRERGVTLEGYSPFKASRLNDARLVEIAEQHGKTPAEVIVRWHLQHGIVVIPRSARRERIESNADVFDFELDADQMQTLDALGRAR